MTRIWTWPHGTGVSGHQSGVYRTEPRRPLDDPNGPTGKEYVSADVHDAVLAELACLRAFVADFAAFKFDAPPMPYVRDPADQPDPVTDAGSVWAWQDDARRMIPAKEAAE